MEINKETCLFKYSYKTHIKERVLMKILIIHRNSFDVIGGAESTLYYMASALKNSGHTPVIVAKQRDSSYDDNDFCKIVRYTSFKMKSKFSCLFLPYFEYKNAIIKLPEIIKKENPDYIITRDNILACVISQVFDKNKVVYIPLVIIKYYNKGIRKFNSVKTFIIEVLRYIQMKQESHYQIKAFKNLKKVIVFSNNVKKQALSAAGSTLDITVVHPGVSEKFFAAGTYTDIRNKFNIPADKKILLFVGRVVQEKNIKMLLQAFSCAHNSNVVLFIVGDGDELIHLKKQANSLGIADKVIFTGMRRDTEKFYGAADFFVLPSYYEAFGNVVLESFASGVPVIGFKTEPGKTLTAIDELVEEGKSGFICKDYSVNSLTESINNALDISGTTDHEKMKIYCADSARQKYTWNNFISNTLKILKK